MTFFSLRQYFVDRMRNVDADLREWEDAFNVENIPASILDKSWHLSFSPFQYTGTAHTCLNFNAPTLLRVFLKGYRYPKEAVDRALNMADAIVKECTDPKNRLNQAGIKNILPGSIVIQELGSGNDNAAILEIQFSNTVII